jgi:hypothetical protein
MKDETALLDALAKGNDLPWPPKPPGTLNAEGPLNCGPSSWC